MNLPFEYTLKRRRRSTASIQVTADNRVIVSAPHFLSESKIRDFLYRKRDWILKNFERNHVERETLRPKQFQMGEVFPYLGRELRLEQDGEHFYLRGESFSARHTSLATIKDWYHERAEEIFGERVVFFERQLGLVARSVKIKETASQWGSCNRHGNISLNWKIIGAPLAIVDYVIVHELVHMIHLNHSVSFWQKVAEILPDYAARRKWLNQNSRALSALL